MNDGGREMDAETLLAGYFARYEPEMAKLGKALRAKLRGRLPGLSEFVYVYENQNSLVISYTPTQHGKDGVCSTALYPDCVKLFFTRGGQLAKADPSKLLQGSGKGVRHVVLNAAADFDRPEIEALMAAALKLANVRLDATAKGAVIIKAEEQKQRAVAQKKRAGGAARAARGKTARASAPASARRTAKARG